MKMIKELYFGYDLENVEKVESYMNSNYKENVDYERVVGMGDDVMNCLVIYNKEILEDKSLFKLVDECDGKGEYVEE